MEANFTRKLYLIVLLQLLAFNVFVKAETITATTYNGGTGTQEDPYQINTLAQLRRLSETSEDWDAFFIQTADIDASDTQTWNVGDHDDDISTADEAMGFSPIGDNIYTQDRQGINFTGSYNGNGYSISQLFINRPKESCVGLFGEAAGDRDDIQEIKYLAVVDANILGDSFVGIIAGQSVFCEINNCFASGNVKGVERTGGLVGNCGYARNCYVKANVICDSPYKGGLGCAYWDVKYLINCYYDVNVYTESNKYGYGIGLSTTDFANLSYYADWNIVKDETLTQGLGPVLFNNDNNPIWRINPATAYTVTFRIINSDGYPIVGATLKCIGATTTDENGEVKVNLIANTSISYSVESIPGKQLYIGEVTVEESNVTEEITVIDAYDGGSGTEEDPYKIANLLQLKNLSQNTQDWGSYFIQTSDIDAENTKNWNVGDHDGDPSTEDVPMGFSPIGDCSTNNMRQGIYFKGSYNGNGYSIANLYINRPNENYVGLFGYANQSTREIKYLALIDADVRGRSSVGLFVGQNCTNVINCYSSGIVHGGWQTGGLVGSCMYSNVNNVDQCYSIAIVDCSSDRKGGLGCGYWNSIENKECYYSSDIFTEPNEYEFGVPLSTQEMGNVSYYSKWSVLIDESLIKGAPPVLDNNGNNPTWKINPATTYTVIFSIKDSEGNPVEGASIICKGKRFTSQNEDIQVSLLPNSSAEYVIIAPGFILEKGTVSVEVTDVLKEVSLTDAYNGGDGTEGNPYQIANLEQLQHLSENYWDWGSDFIQMADIDALDTENWNVGDHDNNELTEEIPMGFSPIGDGNSQYARQGVPFTGNYNGNGYSVSNLYINRPKENYVGLFGSNLGVNGGVKELQSLALIDAKIKGNMFVGTIAGKSTYVRIKNCYATGIVCGENWNSIYTGGLVGQCGFATNCYTSSKVVSGNSLNGGLGVKTWSTSYLTNCYYNSDIYTDSNENGYGTGLTTEQMRNQSSFNTWDFVDESTNGDEDIWAICSEYNNGYPYFARGRSTPEITFTSFSVEYNGSSRTINDSPYLTTLPFSNVLNEPSQTLKATSEEGDLKAYYRLANQETEQEWSSVGPVNAGVYDVKLYVEPYGAFLANVRIVEGGMTITKADAVITFDTLGDKSYGDESFELTGTVTGDATLIYTSSNTDVATISGNVVTIVGAGSTSITASAAETINSNAAADVVQSLTVIKADAKITFNALEDKSYDDESFELAGIVTGDATLIYTSSNTDVATVSGNVVTIVGVGSTNITARATETTNSNAATDVVQSLTVTKADAVITFNALEDKTYGDESFELSGTVTGDGTITYTSSNTDVATVSGNVVTVVGAGNTNITASTEETANYNAAANVTQSLTINKAVGQITWSIEGSTLEKTTVDDNFILEEATTTTGTGISYTSDDTSVATVDIITGEVNLVAIGTAIITATADESVNYNKAISTVTIKVSVPTAIKEKEVQIISIYPNPASTEVRIDGAENNMIEIYSITGSKVMSINNTSIVNVSKLPKGAYIVKVGKCMKRLIVK